MSDPVSKLHAEAQTKRVARIVTEGSRLRQVDEKASTTLELVRPKIHAVRGLQSGVGSCAELQGMVHHTSARGTTTRGDHLVDLRLRYLPVAGNTKVSSQAGPALDVEPISNVRTVRQPQSGVAVQETLSVILR
ncbi:hypothetical protein ST47_g3896 [Ascochyta rabiei]|uniref:Uncharacterized protein n=1 Tax=Didymella rabiei TaxID=5454 RepID=A0A163GQ33_DIDRA|nr:hypothetical protein ST47_g3896 [Ascochyta rabiei]